MDQNQTVMDMTLKHANYTFLGYEFLLYLWFKGEVVKDFPIVIGDKIVFSKFNDEGKIVESITIKGEESDAIIGKVAMTEGFSLTEMKIEYSKDNPTHSVTLKGSELALNSLKCPKVEKAESDSDADGVILENIYHIETISNAIDKEYASYIISRVDGTWSSVVKSIKEWIEEG